LADEKLPVRLGSSDGMTARRTGGITATRLPPWVGIDPGLALRASAGATQGATANAAINSSARLPFGPTFQRWQTRPWQALLPPMVIFESG